MMKIGNMGGGQMGGLQTGAVEGTKGVPKNANGLGGSEQSSSTGQDMATMLKTLLKVLEAAMKSQSSSPADGDSGDDTTPTQPANQGHHRPQFIDKTAAPGGAQAGLGGGGFGGGIQ